MAAKDDPILAAFQDGIITGLESAAVLAESMADGVRKRPFDIDRVPGSDKLPPESKSFIQSIIQSAVNGTIDALSETIHEAIEERRQEWGAAEETPRTKD